MWHELIHMYLAGYLVAGFIVAGVYAYAWLKGRRDQYHRTALVVTLAFASLVAPVQVIVGDWAGREVAERQPVKLAAMEGLQADDEGAPFTFGGFYDERRGEVRFGIEVPRLLSLLAYHDPNATVDGLDSVPPRGPPAGQHRALRVPDDGRDRHRPRAARRRVPRGPGAESAGCRARLVLPRGDGSPARCRSSR